MKKLMLFVAGLFIWPLVEAMEENQVEAYRNGNRLLIRSSYSFEYDIVIASDDCNERSYLVKKGSDLLQYAKGKMIHHGGDDFAPHNLRDTGYIGGNHGSISGRTLKLSHHGLTKRAIGSILTDEMGNTYCLMRIVDGNTILIHPENQTKIPGKRNYPRANTKKFKMNGNDLNAESITTTQMHPLNRYVQNEILLDGKTPLPDNEKVIGNFIRREIELDFIMPDELIRAVKTAPGKNLDFLDPKLEPTCREKITFDFQGSGTTVIHRNIKFLKAVNTPYFQGITQYGWNKMVSEFPKHEIYVPKIKPFGWKKQMIDFGNVYTLPADYTLDLMLKRSDSVNPDDPPDRFINLLSGKDGREFGVVVGYSLFSGMTAKSAKGKDREKVYYFYKSKKLYPIAVSVNSVNTGKVLDVTCYRTYLNPKLVPDATSFYWYQEGGFTFVYLDFHKETRNLKVKLPNFMTGKTISVIEKSPSVVLLSGEKVSENGIMLSVNDKSGFLVMKLE